MLGTTPVHWWLYLSLLALVPWLGWGRYLFRPENRPMKEELDFEDDADTKSADDAPADLGEVADNLTSPGELSEASETTTPVNHAAPPGQAVITPQEALQEITRLEQECRAAERELELAKSEAKEAKEYFDGRVQALLRYIRGSTTPLPMEKLWTKPTSGETTPVPESAASDEWRLAPLSVVLANLPEKKLQILADAELTTLGQLEDFRAVKGGYDWGLKGIGAEWRSRIEETVLNWLAENRQPATDAVEELEPEETETDV